MRRLTSQCQRPHRLFIAPVLALLVLFLNLLAASPSLHQAFHHDADHAEHQCAVTLFAHGGFDTATVAVPIIVSVALVEAAPTREFPAYRPVIAHLPAGRGPPASAYNT